MKSLLVLGALLLSASPAIADNFVYLECTTNLSASLRHLNSTQIERDQFPEDLQHFKLDLANSRLMTASNLEWEEGEIINGAFVKTIDNERQPDGSTMTLESSIQFDPPGRITGEALVRNDSFESLSKMTGMCKGVDASVFDKVLDARS